MQSKGQFLYEEKAAKPTVAISISSTLTKLTHFILFCRIKNRLLFGSVVSSQLSTNPQLHTYNLARLRFLFIENLSLCIFLYFIHVGWMLKRAISSTTKWLLLFSPFPNTNTIPIYSKLFRGRAKQWASDWIRMLTIIWAPVESWIYYAMQCITTINYHFRSETINYEYFIPFASHSHSQSFLLYNLGRLCHVMEPGPFINLPCPCPYIPSHPITSPFVLKWKEDRICKRTW